VAVSLRIDKLELSFGSFQQRDIGWSSDGQCSHAFHTINDARRIDRRPLQHIVEGHTQHKHLGHGSRHVIDRTIDIEVINIGRDRVRQKALIERLAGDIKIEAAHAVTDIEQYASGARVENACLDFPLVVYDAEGMGVVTMRDHIAGTHVPSPRPWKGARN